VFTSVAGTNKAESILGSGEKVKEIGLRDKDSEKKAGGFRGKRNMTTKFPIRRNRRKGASRKWCEGEKNLLWDFIIKKEEKETLGDP